jgi:hypothetical protein
MQEKIENLIWITKKSHVVLIAKDDLVTTSPPIDIDDSAHTMIKNALLFVTKLWVYHCAIMVFLVKKNTQRP